jgi:large subunit ribosomal protein L23
MSIWDKFKTKKRTTDHQVRDLELEKDLSDNKDVNQSSQVKQADKVGNVYSSRLPIASIKRPIFTERSFFLSSLGKYIFLVNSRTNKSEVKKAIEAIYGVKIAKVNIVNIGGKMKGFGKKLGKTEDVKKAIVTLKKGEKIDIDTGA